MSATTYTVSFVIPPLAVGNRKMSIVKYTITTYGTEGISVGRAKSGIGTPEAAFVTFDSGADKANGPVAALFAPATGIITFIKASDTLVDDATGFICYVQVWGS